MKRNCSILLVEDDADDVYFLTRALQSAGLDLHLDVANDGISAIDFLSKAAERPRRPDTLLPCLVLLDLNLPHKTGLEVLKWIRQESPWKTILVVVLTSSTSETDMHEAYRLGANSYVIKPSDGTQLRRFCEYLKGYWFGWNSLPPLLNPYKVA